jgi:hypothetical protein
MKISSANAALRVNIMNAEGVVMIFSIALPRALSSQRPAEMEYCSPQNFGLY